MSLEPIEPGTTAFLAFETLLADTGLPTRDLLAESARYYALAEGEGAPLAYAGLLPLGEEAMLRSIVVRPEHRGAGVGGRVVELASALAMKGGARRLWLLTTEADGFFARNGWQAASREAAPPVVAASRQFAETCPASAVLMCRTPA